MDLPCSVLLPVSSGAHVLQAVGADMWTIKHMFIPSVHHLLRDLTVEHILKTGYAF